MVSSSFEQIQVIAGVLLTMRGEVRQQEGRFCTIPLSVSLLKLTWYLCWLQPTSFDLLTYLVSSDTALPTLTLRSTPSSSPSLAAACKG